MSWHLLLLPNPWSLSKMKLSPWLRGHWGERGTEEIRHYCPFSLIFAWSCQDCNGIPALPQIQLILPYKISCIRGSSEIPLLSLNLGVPSINTCALTHSAMTLARLAVHARLARHEADSDLRLFSTATWRPQRGQPAARKRPPMLYRGIFTWLTPLDALLRC